MKVTIDITEQELDALEDLATAELNEDERKEAEGILLLVWQRMVNEYTA